MCVCACGFVNVWLAYMSICSHVRGSIRVEKIGGAGMGWRGMRVRMGGFCTWGENQVV